MSSKAYALFPLTVAVLLATVPNAFHSAAWATGEVQPKADEAQKLVGDLRRDEIQLRNTVRANPSDATAHVKLAEIYVKLGNLPAAEVEARLARQYKAPESDVDPLLAQALQLQGKITDLFREVKPGNRSNEAELKVRLTLGLAHLNLHEKEAEPLLQQAEKLDPSAPLPKAAMAQVYLSHDDIARAQEEIAAATAIAPDDPTVLRATALLLLAQNNVDGALKTLGTVLSQHPDEIGALGLRANVLMNQNKLIEAQADLEHALKVAPRHPGMIYLHALLLARQGKPQESDTELSTITTMFNELPRAYYLQGVVKYELAQYQQANAALSKYVARVPDATPARRLLALIAMGQNDYTTAINELKPVVDANPTDTESIAILAKAYLASGRRRSDALDLYQRLATLQPDNVSAAVDVDVLRIQSGQVQEGLAELDKMAQSAQGAGTAGPALVISDMRTGHVSDAARSAQALIDRNPQDSVAKSLLGTVYMVQGKYSEAAAIFKAIVDKDRSLVTAQRSLVQAYIALDKLDDAKTILQGLVQQHPDSVGDQVALARIDARQKNEAAAVDRLRKAQQGAATDPTPGIALLQIYGEEKAWDKATTYGRELELQFPVNPRVVSAIAELRAAAGDGKGAASEFSQLVQAKPNDLDILVRYAAYQFQAGDRAASRATLKSALSVSPQNFSLMSRLANFDLADGGIDKALATARSFAPGHQTASDLIVAGLYERANRLDDAVSTLSAAMKRNPQLPIALKLADDLFDKGEHGPAVETLRAWIKDHPGDFDAQLELAGLYERQSDPASAQQVYEAAYKGAPTNWVIANNLAGIYAAKSDSRARALGEQAYFLAPSPQTTDTYGWALVRTGDAAAGLRLLRDAAKALPDNNVVMYHLAVALKDTGSAGEARDILQKVIGSGAAFDEENAAKRLLEQLQHG